MKSHVKLSSVTRTELLHHRRKIIFESFLFNIHVHKTCLRRRARVRHSKYSDKPGMGRSDVKNKHYKYICSHQKFKKWKIHFINLNGEHLIHVETCELRLKRWAIVTWYVTRFRDAYTSKTKDLILNLKKKLWQLVCHGSERVISLWSMMTMKVEEYFRLMYIMIAPRRVKFLRILDMIIFYLLFEKII